MAQGWRYQPWWSMTGGSLLSLCRSTSAFRQVWRRVVVDVFADDGPVGDGMHRDLHGRLALACWQVSLVEGEADGELGTAHERRPPHERVASLDAVHLVVGVEPAGVVHDRLHAVQLTWPLRRLQRRGADHI